MRRLPQFVRHIWADFNGYFWKPCPICGQMFGGQEVQADGSWLDGPPSWTYDDEGNPFSSWSTGVCVCPNCVLEARRRNAAGEYNTIPKKPDVWDLARRLEEVERIMPRMVALDKWFGALDATPSPTAPTDNDAA